MKWLNGWSAAATFEGEFSNVTRSYAGKGVVRHSCDLRCWTQRTLAFQPLSALRQMPSLAQSQLLTQAV
jgi:hypothetical protein